MKIYDNVKYIRYDDKEFVLDLDKTLIIKKQ